MFKKFFLMIIIAVGISTISGADPVDLSSGTWRFSGNVTIQSVIEWQDNASVCFILSNGEICYVPYAEDKMISLVIAAYVAGVKVEVHTYNSTPVTIGGLVAYRVHRLWLKKS